MVKLEKKKKKYFSNFEIIVSIENTLRVSVDTSKLGHEIY